MKEKNDEIHFVINCDNNRTLGFCGDDVVKLANHVPGEDPMLTSSNPRCSYCYYGQHLMSILLVKFKGLDVPKCFLQLF